MNNKIRIINDNIREPAMHFAVEEAILRSIDERRVPATLRIRRSIPAVWIGVFQKADEDVDLALAQKYNIPVMRRYNPGGAVYQDEGTVCYSFFFSKNDFFTYYKVNTPEELYIVFGNIVIKTLKYLNIIAELSPYNDVLVNGKKIYGSAQVEYYSAFVHSGTFLVSCNLDRMAELLRPSKLKYADRGYTDVRNRVINICDLTAESITPESLADAFIATLASELQVQTYSDALTDYELQMAEQLYTKKYSTHAWTYKNEAQVSKLLSKKLTKGVLTLALNIEAGIIKSADIRGDFLIPDISYISRLTDCMKEKTISSAVKALEQLDMGSSMEISQALIKLLHEIQ